MARISGIGTYIRNVVPRVTKLAPDWRFTVVTAAEDTRWVASENVRVLESTAPIYSLREQVELAARVPRDADLFWSTHYNFPLLYRGPRVVTIHDLGHLRLAEYATSAAKRYYSRLMFGLARKRAAGLLFVSRFAREEFHALVGDFDEPEAIVYHGVDPIWSETPMDAPPLAQPYFVYVGNVKPHKNLHLLLDAFERVRDRLGAQLAIIGRAEELRTVDRAVHARVSAMARVALLGEADDASLRRYVRHAAALILPSLYEGFGLPPLEAMAAGCPALVSRAGSLPEVCGDGAAYFDPTDVDALAALMVRSATDQAFRASLREKGHAHVRRFDWNASARATHELLGEVMAKSA